MKKARRLENPFPRFPQSLNWGWQLLFLLESFGLASLFIHQEPSLNKFLGLPLWLKPLLVISLTLFVYGGAKFMVFHPRFLSSLPEDGQSRGPKILLCFSPFVLASLIWLGHFYFLHEYRSILTLSIIIGTVYLSFLIKPFSGSRRELQKTTNLFFNQPPLSLALIIFIILVLIYNLLASGLLFPPQPFTGDEPHYLLLTSSLLQDFDTNLANNFKNQDYLAFYPGKLRPHTYPGRKKDSAYSQHSPGLAFLLLPGLALGRKISAPISSPEKKRKILVWFSRIPMTVMSALVVSLFFLLAHLIYQQKKWLFIGALFWGLSPPFIFYSHLLYPEIPAALLLLIPFWLLGKKKFSSPNWQEILISSCCFSLLPWLGVKYIPLAGLGFLILGRLILIQLLNRHFPKLITISSLLLPFLLSGGFLLLYTWQIYGTLSPVSFYQGLSPGENLHRFFHFSLPEALRCGLGYFLDQRAGLIPYNLLFLLVIAGSFSFFHLAPRLFAHFGALFVLYWGFTSLSYYWGGYCPPGRTLLPLIWVLWIFSSGCLLRLKSLSQKTVSFYLLVFVAAITFAGLKNPALLYHQNLSFPFSQEGTFSHILQELSNSLINFTSFFPYLSNPQFFQLLPLVIWLLIWLGITGLFLPGIQKSTQISPFSKRKLNSPLHKIKSTSLFLIKKEKYFFLPARGKIVAGGFLYFLIILVTSYSFFDLHLNSPQPLNGRSSKLIAQNNHLYGPEEGGFWTQGQSRADIIIKSPAKISKVVLSISSPISNKVTIKQGFWQKKITILPSQPRRITLTSASLTYFPGQNNYFYALAIKAEQGFYPFRLNPRSTDRRFLGIFWRLELVTTQKP